MSLSLSSSRISLTPCWRTNSRVSISSLSALFFDELCVPLLELPLGAGLSSKEVDEAWDDHYAWHNDYFLM